MSDATISNLSTLLVTLLALAIGVRIGYILVARGTAREIEMINRHFENGLALSKQQHEVQLEADQRRRSRDDLKRSYEQLSGWLHDLTRTFDEIFWGCQSSDGEARGKAAALLDRPWSVLSTPPDLAPVEMYWSPRVAAQIRGMTQPFVRFVWCARPLLSDEEKRGELMSRLKDDLWKTHDDLLLAVQEVRNQIRRDLGVASLDH